MKPFPVASARYATSVSVLNREPMGMKPFPVAFGSPCKLRLSSRRFFSLKTCTAIVYRDARSWRFSVAAGGVPATGRRTP